MNALVGPVSLFLQAWPDPKTGDDVLNNLSRLQRERAIQIIGAGSIVHLADGKFHIRSANPDISDGAILGLLGGMLIGLLGGPVFWLEAGVVGALSGGALEHLTKVGFTKAQLDAVKDAMPRNSSAVFAVVFDNRVADFMDEMAKQANIAMDKLIKVSLKANVAEQLTTAMQQAQQVHSTKEPAPH